MELTFTYKPELKLYIAEFRADKEFNIHIERPEPGYISMQQNSAEGGKYAAVDDWGTQNNDKLIIDYESGYFVTPKFIKIISKVLPTYAAITTDGDVVEIKSQAKVVEITSNGTTSVEPDAGFSYLSKVDVKVDVPQSGEGGGESGGDTGGSGGNMEYISLEDVNFASTAVRTALIKMSYAFKYLYEHDGNKNIIITAMYNKPENATVYAVAIDFSFKIGDKSMIFSVKEYLTQTVGLDTDTLPRITEEEFYNLES